MLVLHIFKREISKNNNNNNGKKKLNNVKIRVLSFLFSVKKFYRFSPCVIPVSAAWASYYKWDGTEQTLAFGNPIFQKNWITKFLKNRLFVLYAKLCPSFFWVKTFSKTHYIYYKKERKNRINPKKSIFKFITFMLMNIVEDEHRNGKENAK